MTTMLMLAPTLAAPKEHRPSVGLLTGTDPAREHAALLALQAAQLAATQARPPVLPQAVAALFGDAAAG